MPTTRGTGALLPRTTTRTTPTPLFLSSRIADREHVSMEDVFDAYRSCRKHKRRKSSAVLFEMNYEMECHRLYVELNTRVYRPTTSRAFCVTRPKLREVFAAAFRDRVVHHLFFSRLNRHFEQEMGDCAFACRKGKGTLYGIRRVAADMAALGGDAWYARCDIRGFFMSIDREILYGEVRRIVLEHGVEDADWWLWLARTIIFHRPEKDCVILGDRKLWEKLPRKKSLFFSGGVGLPIGNLTSQLFANVYMGIFDRLAKGMLGESGRYGRYVDDFMMMHPDRRLLLETVSEARAFLRLTLRLDMHPRKVAVQQVRRGVRFTGMFIKGGRLLPARRTTHNAMAVMRSWKGGTEGQLRRFVCRANSYLGLLRHGDTSRLRRRMWREIRDYNHICLINNKKIKITGL